jgi:hypothetical protein
MQIEIKDAATPAIANLRKKLADPRKVNDVMGKAALPVFRDNFKKLNSTNHNKFGLRSTFWDRMIEGTRAVASIDVATIVMPREVALRYYGGTVRPKKANFLAIPARQEAYGKSPRDFSDLCFAVLNPGGPVLIQNEQSKISYRKNRKTGQRQIIRGESTGGGVFYWLKPSAAIKKNPNVLPTPGEVLDAVAAGINDYLEATP